MLWLPPLSDKYGRKYFFQIGIFGNLAVYYIIKETNSLYTVIIAQFFCGVLNSLRTTVGFVYLMELLPRRLQQYYGNAWGIYESSISLIGTYYFW